MVMKDIYSSTVSGELKKRVLQLNKNTAPHWGKMNAAQMLAHLNLMFKISLEDNPKRPPAFVRFIMQLIVKPIVINEKPYKKNSGTAPEMKVIGGVNFEAEQDKLISYLFEVSKKRRIYFENRVHPVFGKLTTEEWSRLFYKHINHHFEQFGL